MKKYKVTITRSQSVEIDVETNNILKEVSRIKQGTYYLDFEGKEFKYSDYFYRVK